MTNGHRLPETRTTNNQTKGQKMMKQIYNVMANTIKKITTFSKFIILLSALIFGAWNDIAWANTVASKNSSDDVKNGKIVMEGNHATFTFAVTGKTITHNGINYSGMEVAKNSTVKGYFSWITNSGVSIKVTKISLDVTGYINNTQTVFGGKTTDVGSALGVMKTISASNNSGLSNNVELQLKNTSSGWIGGSRSFYISNISITYTITPDAPTIDATTATINVSLTDENKLDMTTLIGVSDVNDFMPVSFGSKSFSDPLGISTAGAYTFTGKYFYATKAGVYTFNNPYIAAKTDCHAKSATTTGTITITVNRLNQTLTMSNGSVDVTTDKSHPTKLDLSTLCSHVGNGAVTYELVSGPTSLSGDPAADNCNISGKNFYAWVVGTYTLRASAPATAQYNAAIPQEFTVVVNKRVNTLTTTATYTKYVDETITSVTTSKNSDGEIHTSSSDGTIAYYDIAKNKIFIPNSEAKSFHSTTVTIKIWQDETPCYEGIDEANAKTITLTVNKYPTSITGTSTYNLMVDATQEADYTYTNTSAARPTANSADNFYYALEDVEFTNEEKNKGNKFITFSPSNKLITAYNAGTGVITLRQKETYKFTGDTASFVVNVYKYKSTYANVANLTTQVDEDVTSAYTLTYTKPKNAYIGENNIAAGAPALNEGEFHYTLTQSVTTSHTEGSPDASLAITYDADTKTATGKNQGKGTIRLYQEETYKYNAANKTFTVTVSKHDNTLACSLGSFSKFLNFDRYAITTFSASNTNYAVSPISVEQTSGNNIATYYPDPDNVIWSSHNIGEATWMVSQPEDYKYKAVDSTMTVTVGTIASGGCNLVEYSSNTDKRASEWHFPLPETGTAGTLYFQMKKNGLTGNDARLCAMVNNKWDTIDIKVSGLLSYYKDMEPIELNPNTTAIRFDKSAALLGEFTTDDPYINNIRITRKTWLKTEDIAQNPISSLTIPTNTVGRNTKTAKFFVNYSTCDTIVKVVSSDSRIVVNPTSFKEGHAGRKEITVSYTSGMVEEPRFSATITIYTEYEHVTLIVYAETKKEDQTLIWRDGFNGDPITLPLNLIRDSVAVASSHNLITYTSSNPSIIKVSPDGRSIEVVGVGGPVTLTAHADGDSHWNPITESKVVYTTAKKVQMIVWENNYTDMYVGDAKDLNAVVKVYDLVNQKDSIDEERTKSIVYTPSTSIVSVGEDTRLHANTAGEATITASLGGDAEYEAAASVVKPVAVRALPDGNCVASPMFNNPNEIEFYAFNLELPEIVNYINLGHTRTSGDPDTLIFSVRGKKYKGFAFNGNIELYQSTDNGVTWGTRLEIIEPIVEQTIWDTIVISPNATHLKFVRPQGGYGYTYVGNIKVTCKPGFKCDYSLINGMPEVDLGNVIAGATRSDHITFDYFCVKGDLVASKTIGSNAQNVLTLGHEIIPLDCGASGTYQLPIEFHPMVIGEWADTVTVTDPISGFAFNVRVKATVTKGTQMIIWDPVLTLYQPQVPSLDAIATSNLPVNYQILSGGEIATIVDGKIIVTGTGKITIQATQPGNESFEPATPVEKVFTIYLYVFLGTASNPSEKEMWHVAENWNLNSVPTAEHNVTIRNKVTVTNGEVAAHKMTIGSEGKVVISYDGGMKIGKGGIVGATAENLILKADTCSKSSTKGQTGYLRISPEYTGEMPNATVELFSIGYYDYEDDSDNIAKWQFVGSPLASDDVLAKTVYTKSWVYSWDEENDDWYNSRSKLTLKPFEGFLTTQRSFPNGALLTYTGQLVSNQGKVTVDLAYSGEGKGLNVIANSFAAPIDMTKFEDSDFQNVDTVICLFNTGSRTDIASIADTKDIDVNAPGQYLYIPVGSMMHMKKAFPTTPTTIAPMQGFCVQANGEDASITFDYDKLVYRGDYVENKITPLRAPSRHNNAEETLGALQVSLFANGWLDHLFLLEDEDYSPMYESGLDARKRMSGDLNIFAVENGSMLAVDATNSIDGTYIGVRTGDSKKYTFIFSHLNSEKELVLFDIEADETIDIIEGAEYTFYAEPNSMFTERFQIIAREDSHGVTTGSETIGSDSKVKKFIQNNQVYILKDGILYNVWGARVQ